MLSPVLLDVRRTACDDGRIRNKPSAHQTRMEKQSQRRRIPDGHHCRAEKAETYEGSFISLGVWGRGRGRRFLFGTTVRGHEMSHIALVRVMGEEGYSQICLVPRTESSALLTFQATWRRRRGGLSLPLSARVIFFAVSTRSSAGRQPKIEPRCRSLVTRSYDRRGIVRRLGDDSRQCTDDLRLVMLLTTSTVTTMIVK